MDSSNEQKLFLYAMKQIEEAGLMAGDWAVGGGTVLKHIFEHRMSKDIDIFFDDPQKLGALSPRFNEANDENLVRYFEDAVCIKLIFPEGKVDFVVAGHVTDFKPRMSEFHGESVMMDDPVEIVAKKIWHRGAEMKERDLFDLATLYLSERREDLIKSARGMPEKIHAMEEKIKSLDADVSANITQLPNGKQILG